MIVGLRGHRVCVARFEAGSQDKWCTAKTTGYVVRSCPESQSDTGNSQVVWIDNVL